MRYIRQESMMTTVFDEDIDDAEVVRSLFKAIIGDRVRCSITVKKRVGYTENIVNYSSATIIKMDDESDCIDIRVFAKGASACYKGIKCDDVVGLKVADVKNSILVLKDKVSKFDLIDIEKNKSDA